MCVCARARASAFACEQHDMHTVKRNKHVARVSAPDYLKACQAFGILGLLVIAGCLTVGVLICFLENEKLPLIAAVLGIVSGERICMNTPVHLRSRPDITPCS